MPRGLHMTEPELLAYAERIVKHTDEHTTYLDITKDSIGRGLLYDLCKLLLVKSR